MEAFKSNGEVNMWRLILTIGFTDGGGPPGGTITNWGGVFLVLLLIMVLVVVGYYFFTMGGPESVSKAIRETMRDFIGIFGDKKGPKRDWEGNERDKEKDHSGPVF